MPFLTLKYVTVPNSNGDSINHPPQTVLSDWEIAPNVREQILAGADWYRALFEPLTEREAYLYRVAATQREPAHILIQGGAQTVIAPPFEDYVGLHPSEIVDRLRKSDLAKTIETRRYEQAVRGSDPAMKRDEIISYIHPAERLPFQSYNDLGATDICDKLEMLPDAQVAEAKIYEAAHLARPAILEFEKEAVLA
jgi:hypothetical protein